MVGYSIQELYNHFYLQLFFCFNNTQQLFCSLYNSTTTTPLFSTSSGNKVTTKQDCFYTWSALVTTATNPQFHPLLFLLYLLFLRNLKFLYLSISIFETQDITISFYNHIDTYFFSLSLSLSHNLMKLKRLNKSKINDWRSHISIHLASPTSDSTKKTYEGSQFFLLLLFFFFLSL